MLKSIILINLSFTSLWIEFNNTIYLLPFKFPKIVKQFNEKLN